MVIQSSSPNQLQEFVGILRRRFWQVLIPAAVVIAVGIAVANFLPKRYKVTTRVAVRETTLPGPGTGANTIQRDVGTAPTEIMAPQAIRDVIRRQEWQDYAGLTRQEQLLYEDRVRENMSVNVRMPGKQGGTSYISISYTDSDGQRAQRFANMLREHYIETVMGRVKSKSEALLVRLKELMLEAQQEWLDIGEERTELVKANGLSSTQPAPGSGQQRTEDSTKVQLDSALQELDQVELELESLRGRLETVQVSYQSEPLEKEVFETKAKAADTAEIDEIEDEIAALREELEGKKPRHHGYKRAAAEIAKLEARRDKLLANLDPVEQEAQGKWVPNERRIELGEQIQELEQQIAGKERRRVRLEENIRELEYKHEALQNVYATYNVLTVELGSHEADYVRAQDAWMRQRDFVSLLDGPEANPFELIEVAEATDVPTAPNVTGIIAFAAVLGLGLGLGSAMAAEYLRNGYRNVGELSRAMAVPVLGVINGIVTRHEARRRTARRIMVGTSSLVMIGAILWVTWAYKNRPLLLGPQVTQLIDGLREQFR